MAWTEKQLQIMRACSKLLENTESGNLTTVSIASELNVSEAMLYRHFPSKNRIIMSLMDFAEITLVQSIEEILQEAQEKGLESTLKDIYLGYSDFFQANPGIARLISGEVPVKGRQLCERISFLFDQLTNKASGQLNRQATKEKSQIQAKIRTLVLEGNIKQWIRAGFAYDLSQRFEGHLDSLAN